MKSIHLTRRGRATLGICVAGVLLATLSGTRSLNAVVFPGLIALGAAYVQLARLDPPGVRRDLPPDDFVGTTHTTRLTFHHPETPGADLPDTYVARVRDEVGDGLSGPDADTRTTVGAVPVEYELDYERRGEHELGPVTVFATDVFGLLERDLLCRDRGAVLVYPPRHPVPGWFRRELYDDEALGTSRQRDEFDRLREYARGDALRDVHWPTTAKRDELIVKEFAAETEQRRVAISGGSRGRAADDLAEATTSIALELIDDGVPVDVSLPNGTVSVRSGPEQRRRLLELTARVPDGRIPDPEADVVIDADHAETTVRIDGEEIPFTDLREAAAAPRAVGGDGVTPVDDTDAGDDRAAIADGGAFQ